MLQAMHTEIELQKSFLHGAPIETIYFGGGTPSVLDASEIQSLIDKIAKYHTVASNAEITLEANPDDLEAPKVKELRNTAVNRFSIGVQSFFEEDLRWMNRAHTAQEAESAVKRVQDTGFENITVDLIYGYPLLSDNKWESNIKKVIALSIPHVSAYSMTVEPQTALASFIRKGKQIPMNEAQSAAQFKLLISLLQEAGYEQYEISNFAKPGHYAVHNANYWKGIPYLGIGPSAHSFNGETRQWNITNNAKYIDSLIKETVPAEVEVLSVLDRINEYIMTSLRTSWGMSLEEIERRFSSDYRHMIQANLEEFLSKNWVKNVNGIITLTEEGKLFADHIASELFLTDI